jgi:3-deoxy-D-manno-octulosonate 8-phosphate phosphatase (KDO 8-P phosphatase)
MLKDDVLAARCRRLKLLLTDVDGVMTDGRVWLLGDGSEARAFHVRDGLALMLARRAGLATGLLSGRSSPAVARRAEQLEMTVVRQGLADKPQALAAVLAEHGLEAREVAYMGDDFNDLAVIQSVGLSAAPADAPLEVRAQVDMVTQLPGGGGCLREFVEAILRSRGDWDRVVAGLGSPLEPR